MQTHRSGACKRVRKLVPKKLRCRDSDTIWSMNEDQTPQSETVINEQRSTRAKRPRYDTTFHDLDLHLPPTTDDSIHTSVSGSGDEYSRNESPSNSETSLSLLAISYKFSPAHFTRVSGSAISDQSNSISQLGHRFIPQYRSRSSAVRHLPRNSGYHRAANTLVMDTSKV